MAENVIQVGKENFEKEVLQSSIPVVVDFWAIWCGPCKFLAPVVDELATEYAGKVKFTKLNTDDDQEIAIKYGIFGIPTLKVFRGGQEIDSMSGAAPKDYVKDFIDKALAKK
jgi:thioredoxin 1